jgi:hypothetical protein
MDVEEYQVDCIVCFMSFHQNIKLCNKIQSTGLFCVISTSALWLYCAWNIGRTFLNSLKVLSSVLLRKRERFRLLLSVRPIYQMRSSFRPFLFHFPPYLVHRKCSHVKRTVNVKLFIRIVGAGIHQLADQWTTGWQVGVPFPAGTGDLFSSPQCPYWLWGPSSLLSSGNWGQSGCDMKPITHLHLMPSSRMVELYLSFPIRLHGVVLIN